MSTATELRWIDMVAGVKRRTLVSGETMHQMHVSLQAGSHLPEHRHPHEQIIHVIEGHIRVTVGDVAREVAAGESFYLASNVSHAVDALKTTLVLDTFSPPRDDLLAQDRGARDA